jgi:hypothetical protein
MKNVTTPRTLADCNFSVGYSGIDYIEDAARLEHRGNVVMYVLIAACAVLAVFGIFGA